MEKKSSLKYYCYNTFRSIFSFFTYVADENAYMKIIFFKVYMIFLHQHFVAETQKLPAGCNLFALFHSFVYCYLRYTCYCCLFC